MLPILLALGYGAAKQGKDAYDTIGLRKEISPEGSPLTTKLRDFLMGSNMLTSGVYKSHVEETLAENQARDQQASLGGGLTKAFESQKLATQSNISQLLAQAAERTNIAYGTQGLYNSGERLQAQGDLSMAASRDLSNSIMGSALQTSGLQEQSRQFDVNTQLKLAEMGMQEDQIKGQIATSLGQALAPIIYKKFLSQYLGGASPEGEFDPMDLGNVLNATSYSGQAFGQIPQGTPVVDYGGYY